MIGVVGGSGGVGASCFAAVLALVAAPAMLVDLDCAGGGIDVVLGVEQRPGARWSGLQVAGGRLDPADLAGGLPRAGGASVLAADLATLDADAVLQVVAAAVSLGPVVLDLPRADTRARAAALVVCDLVVLLARADVAGLVAAHAAAAALADVRVGLVVRRGEVSPREAAALVGVPLLGVLPSLRPGRFALDPGRPPRPASRVAAGVLAGVAAA
ncbi:MinD-like ATPase involved in chromosome partitioning or flagellar assembly [Jatrophihabitans endophyticus]|uniref:MinD-like ATPase involved in chromosome partitioning or flagellar assembly n=1 Tax=Jatrophihabitans endophyticus TaxID=1206085 RepID=A0A1M5H2D3_9ACTN|nr:MinD-like ATPase involved in chromosome partitioning or flagellar assembly [Jatrophihabitans endophyticus]